MNKTAALFALFAILLGTGSMFLYRQNEALGEAIRSNAAQCEQQVADLKSKYQAEIDDLRRDLFEQYSNNPETAAQIEKPRFNKLISHQHRAQAIQHKYDFLFNSALIDNAEKKKLRRLLFERERLAELINTQTESGSGADSALQADLDTVEAQIHVLLQDPLDYDHYEMLRQRDF
jgi:type VI protein secretion system component VasK